MQGIDMGPLYRMAAEVLEDDPAPNTPSLEDPMAEPEFDAPEDMYSDEENMPEGQQEPLQTGYNHRHPDGLLSSPAHPLWQTHP